MSISTYVNEYLHKGRYKGQPLQSSHIPVLTLIELYQFCEKKKYLYFYFLQFMNPDMALIVSTFPLGRESSYILYS